MARMIHITCHDERGMTTAGMVVALLLTLSMIFSTAQVYRIQSVASKVQSVADASALAAQNVVGEFMIAVRLCDAVVLSLSLTGLSATGLGVVAICVPGGQALGEKFIEAGKKVIDSRDSFSKRAVEGLNKVQRALPFLSAVAAASVASANGKGGAQYAAIAISVPSQTQNINEASDGGAARGAQGVADSEAGDIKRLAQEAEQAANEANSAKERGFQSDCGGAPGYCMYERASTLAGMTGVSNPKYSSVDAWSFSVALKRARAYYPERLVKEQPTGSSVAAQAQSHLRKKFYEYAQREVAKGYVHESDSSFDAYFPRLPKNTTEMKQTTLYTDVAYPCTRNEDGKLVMHAWDGCPSAASSDIVGYGSIQDMDSAGWPKCSECDFAASSMGRVASASSAIDNGFEYHYNAVADAAEDYKKALERAKPAKDGVINKAGGVLEKIVDALKSVGKVRISATPPGHDGCIVLVASVGSDSAQGGFSSLFVNATGSIGQRAAVSAATLVEDTSGEGQNVITSLTGNIAAKGGVLTGAAGTLLSLWSGALNVYTQGTEALSSGIRSLLDGLPLVGASGLGKWAQSKFNGLVKDIGFEPPNLNALRPAIVNSAHVAAAGGDSALCARLTEIKRTVVANPLMSNDTFTSVVQTVERSVFQSIDNASEIEIATIDLGGMGTGVSIPINIALPSAVKDYAKGKMEGLFDSLLDVYASVSGRRSWD